MKPLIVISRRDNVATALEALDAGRRVDLDDAVLTIAQLVPSGHKVALTHISAGAAIVKYGSAIGVATADIEAGAHVHTHNVASARGRGDLHHDAAADDPEAQSAKADAQRATAERGDA